MNNNNNNEERRRELEAKKAKLEEFKRRKLERSLKESLNDNSSKTTATSSVVNVEEIEKIFSEIELKKENDKKYEKTFIKKNFDKKKY
jgi:hypothetical protein